MRAVMVREDTAIRDRISGISDAKARATARVEEIVAVTSDIRAETVAQRGDLTIEFTRPPQVILDKSGAVVGIDVHVSVFRDGQKLDVDPHRVCVNPPVLVPDGTTRRVVTEDGIEYEARNYREDPREAFLVWLEASIRTVPNSRRR